LLVAKLTDVCHANDQLLGQCLINAVDSIGRCNTI
jgi:hypothetical protein